VIGGARTVAGATAVLVALSVAVWLTVASSDEARVAVLAVGVLGALGVGVAVVWQPALGPALGALAGAYAILLVVDDPPLDGRAAGVATALVAIGELVGWSRELTSATRDEPGNAWRRPVWIASVGIASLVVTAGLLAIVDLARLDGLVIEVVGAAAALVVLVALVRLARPGP